MPLLLVPCSAARSAFERWAAWIKAAWIRTAMLILRVALGTRVFLHVRGGARELEELKSTRAPVLLVANHRTTFCYAWIWCLAARLHLQGFRIVLMHTLKHIPGLGWAMQCFGFAFIKRNLGSRGCDGGGGVQLDTVSSTIQAACRGSSPLTLLLFPEGRDLNQRSIQASNEYADQHGLRHYKQVIHPKTGGFARAWETLSELRSLSSPPVLVDATLAFVDYTPGEIPDPVSMFLLGRSPPEVHIAIEIIPSPPQKDTLKSYCQELFARKEEALSAFYAGGGLEPIRGFDAFIASIGDVVSSAFLFALFEAVAVGLCFLLDFRTLCAYAGVESLVFILIGLCGGADNLLLWHAKRWQRCSAREPLL
eukprot:TRINITY_DN65045_c0_g1_i1.p1 TRINITY_DN65045_c0_g1~~TRINITY_DN65045_c0_g1_i1.p1  ORF type:complete len:422 (+),score=43.58 TRINITY_DN65045_c0_g1_i1:169-1266(+)